MELQRESRRLQAAVDRKERQERISKLEASGNPGDVDFIGMVEEWRNDQRKKLSARNGSKQDHTQSTTLSSSSNIVVAIRKRPMSDKERAKRDHDSVTCFQPKVWIHSSKFKVDGITKYLTHTDFRFDFAFGEDSTTDQIYEATTMPLLDHVLDTHKRGTIFAYGQTGSGKTYTMSSIQKILAHDLFAELERRRMEVDVTLTFFEFYGGVVQDLLHDRAQCKVLEDGQGEVNITGLQEVPARNADQFLEIIKEGHSQRTTHTTEANDTSSRSHAICQVFLREKRPSSKPSSSRNRQKSLMGKLTLVDLAGSERGCDTKMHNSQRRTESSEINTSLLSLKECIRALGQKNARVPYRQSKLTMILKDSFLSDSKTTMIATVSPGASASMHTLNTCRYAERVKEHKVRISVHAVDPLRYVALSDLMMIFQY
jgi:kinesin family member 2/24